MSVQQAFQVLGIPITMDKKVIKKTYADLVKKYHPEEEPEKWKEIHDAYEVAIQYNKNQEVITQEWYVEYHEKIETSEERIKNCQPKELKHTDEISKQEQEYIHNQQEYDKLFAAGNEVQLQWKKEKLNSLRRRMYHLIDKKQVSLKEWQLLFSSMEWKEFCHEPEAMSLLANAIEGKKIRKKACNEIEDVISTIHSEVNNAEITKYYKIIKYLLHRSELEKKAKKGKKQYRYKTNSDPIWKYVVLAFAVFLLIVRCAIPMFLEKEDNKEEQRRTELYQALYDETLAQYEEYEQQAYEKIELYEEGAYRLTDKIYLNQISGNIQLVEPDSSFLTSIPEGVLTDEGIYAEDALMEKLNENESIELILCYQTSEEINDNCAVWIIDKSIILNNQDIEEYHCYMWDKENWYEFSFFEPRLANYATSTYGGGIETEEKLYALGNVMVDEPFMCVIVSVRKEGD